MVSTICYRLTDITRYVILILVYEITVPFLKKNTLLEKKKKVGRSEARSFGSTRKRTVQEVVRKKFADPSSTFINSN